jgi:hypothetical protein
MQVDLTKETRAAWLVLAAVTVLGAVVLFVCYDSSDLGERMDAAQDAYQTMTGPVRFSERIDQQREANAKLAESIEVLKKGVGFTHRYTVPSTIGQAGYFFQSLREQVLGRLQRRAQELSIPKVDIYFGFGEGENVKPALKVVPDEEANLLLKMLQLTEKTAQIAFKTPTPLQKLIISHENKAKRTGPESRPALLEEYSLKLAVRGSLTDILFILHNLSQVDPTDPNDYPLALTYFKIDSLNASAKDDIQQLDAEFRIAGMQFLSPEERGLGSTPRASGGRSNARVAHQ